MIPPENEGKVVPIIRHGEQPPRVLGTNVENTLNERAKSYGSFKDQTKITRAIKRAMHTTPGWTRLSDSQMEALDMVAVKIGRLLNGDPNHVNGWHDGAGYFKLVEDELNGVIR